MRRTRQNHTKKVVYLFKTGTLLGADNIEQIKQILYIRMATAGFKIFPKI